ncbi:hypothetical protein K470DRAFT_280505 [Piedraia hortae CBS 480.64]|uniref:Zn(2)-C6 fungal-type domain-containing protein n=1 Tax=Piedraia hortae CBS 480.64 TaxID=1314780 RepID=A0A6A7C786_9PEZI|nr:hypothetical protein K470DRAFT_280505 [Piedraia hortae CBS 480.64]
MDSNVVAASTPASERKEQPVHQRTYQACIPCRRRKVRCDLGSVDHPNDPPCLRCKRECKECYFSSTRRKKRRADGSWTGASDGEGEVVDIKIGRKRPRILSSVGTSETGIVDEEEPPRTPGGGRGRSMPLRRPGSHVQQYTEEDEAGAEHAAAVLQSSEIHSGHDALKLLSLAAQRDALNWSKMDRSSFPGLSPTPLPQPTSPAVDLPMAQPNGGSHASASVRVASDVEGYMGALRAWLRFRFVRAGWFTAKEGIDYVVYFYTHLAPLTPAVLPDFRPYHMHERLLTTEPMLAVTILLIAARHMHLEGPGAMGRPHAIQNKLWKYLSGMINRVVWGQEQLGAESVNEPASDVHPLARRGLRTLGTIESLVLLTEWHPRAVFFPPDEADDELMLPEHPVGTPSISDPTDPSRGPGGQHMDAWLEPCWRSDRMCWMLLGMATSLAYEVGVFDAADADRHVATLNSTLGTHDDLIAYEYRRGNVRDLLLAYVTQTSGRLGATSMVPSTYSNPEDSPTFQAEKFSPPQAVLHFWLRIARLMRRGNEEVFKNKAFTRRLIRSGQYNASIDSMIRPLDVWWRDFCACTEIPTPQRHVLEIEYYYCRVYNCALALQVVAERCTSMSESTTGGSAIPPHELARWLGGDRKYVLAVAEGARNLLKAVVDGLYPNGALRFAPVRTYFRIVGACTMLLKSFALGATASDTADSLQLVDRTIEALQTCVVDDAHVASRFAVLLKSLADHLKPRLVRIGADGKHVKRRPTAPFSVMPPPYVGFDSPMPLPLPLPQADMGDWLTLPLDNLINANADVDASIYGPPLGEVDMLEALLGFNKME